MADTNHGKWEYNGEFKTLREWSRYFGRNVNYFYQRLEKYITAYEKGEVPFPDYKLDFLLTDVGGKIHGFNCEDDSPPSCFV